MAKKDNGGAKPAKQDKAVSLNDIKPEETGDKTPKTADWQAQNAAAIEKAAAPEAVEKALSGNGGARKLLSKIRPAYGGDPLALTVVAAATQHVMLPGKDQLRRKWVAALLEKARGSADSYVKTFCLDQLRWCGYKATAKDVIAVGADSGDSRVLEMAALVARELKGECIGL